MITGNIQGNASCLVMLLDDAKRMLLQAQKEVTLRERKVIRQFTTKCLVELKKPIFLLTFEIN